MDLSVSGIMEIIYKDYSLNLHMSHVSMSIPIIVSIITIVMPMAYLIYDRMNSQPEDNKENRAVAELIEKSVVNDLEKYLSD